ncbi:MAG: hypothetical protein Q4F28_09180 [Eubacteriales bacterium]|nr:hypothetical protein [Eubacteriales bacterium]
MIWKRNQTARTDAAGGMTMVEVVVALAVLLLIMGMFARCLTMTAQTFRHSRSMLEDARNLAKGYYLEDDRAVEITSKEETLVFTSREDGSSFCVEAELRTFSGEQGTLYDVTAPEVPEKPEEEPPQKEGLK